MDRINKRDLILNGNMSKVILTLSAPIMLNNLIQTIYNLTDTYFVSNLGSTEVNSIGFVWPIIFFMMSLGIGISIAGTALISQYTGSNDKENAKKVAGQLISFSFILSIIVGLLGAVSAKYIVKIMGAEGELLNYSTNFLRIIFLGMPTMFLFFAFNSIKQGQGDTVTPMIFGALSVALNIILDPIFIFNRFTIPIIGITITGLDLGVNGAAIATILARGIFAFYAILSLFKDKRGLNLHLNDLKLNKNLLIKIIKIGIPSSIGNSTSALGFAIMNIFVRSFGGPTLTAFIIGNRINSLILMPAMGIGNALATIVGQNLGADNIKRAKSAVKTSIVLSTIFLVIGGSIIFTLSDSVISIFNKDPNPIIKAEVLKQGTFYLKLISASLPLMGIFQTFIGTFQGSGHTMSAMFLMTGRLWGLRIPLILLLKTFTTLGSSAVWFAMVSSNGIICIIGFMIYMTGKWQKKVIKKPKMT